LFARQVCRAKRLCRDGHQETINPADVLQELQHPGLGHRGWLVAADSTVCWSGASGLMPSMAWLLCGAIRRVVLVHAHDAPIGSAIGVV